MIFNRHPQLEGRHAFLGASQFRWINWTDEVLEARFYGQYSQAMGTTIHDLAKDLIQSRTKLTMDDVRVIDITLYKAGIPKGAFNSHDILSNLLPFVNDAIGFRMKPEVLLYYSNNVFGTADAIVFDKREKTLRVHDLKTGVTKTHMEQLMIYAALFCLEYRMKPEDMKFSLKLYQNFEIIEYNPTGDEVRVFMDKIIVTDDKLKNILERNYL